jgi:hypothetical protein
VTNRRLARDRRQPRRGDGVAQAMLALRGQPQIADWTLATVSLGRSPSGRLHGAEVAGSGG